MDDDNDNMTGNHHHVKFQKKGNVIGQTDVADPFYKVIGDDLKVCYILIRYTKNIRGIRDLAVQREQWRGYQGSGMP